MRRVIAADDRLQTAGKLVVRARVFYDIWYFFEHEKTQPAVLEILNGYSEFFRFDSHAHFVAFVVHIAALFESRKDTINLPRLTKELESKISVQTTTEVDALLGRAAPLASKVMILRSNVFAHRNASLSYAEVFKKADVSPNQLRELSEIALESVNHLLIARGLKDEVFADLPSEDAKNILKALAN